MRRKGAGRYYNEMLGSYIDGGGIAQDYTVGGLYTESELPLNIKEKSESKREIKVGLSRGSEKAYILDGVEGIFDLE